MEPVATHKQPFLPTLPLSHVKKANSSNPVFAYATNRSTSHRFPISNFDSTTNNFNSSTYASTTNTTATAAKNNSTRRYMPKQNVENPPPVPQSRISTANSTTSSSGWRSKTTHYELLIMEWMKKFDPPYRNAEIVTLCLNLLEEMGSTVFHGYENVFLFLKRVFGSCIFTDQITTLVTKEGQSIMSLVPFFQKFLLQQQEEENQENVKKIIQTYDDIYQNEKKVNDLTCQLETVTKQLETTQIELTVKKEEISHLQQSIALDKQMRQQAIQELQSKYDKTKQVMQWMKIELRQLRHYKKITEEVALEYEMQKRVHMVEPFSMYSQKSKINTLLDMQSQLEMLENRRLDLYQVELLSSQETFPAQQSLISFSNDVSILTEEMNSIKEEVNLLVKYKPSQVMTSLITPLRDIDAKNKNRSYVEIMYSMDHGQHFHFLHRAALSETNDEPSIVAIPQPTNRYQTSNPIPIHLKIIHSKYNYSLPHPNPYTQIIQDKSYSFDNSNQQEYVTTYGIELDANSILWKEYKKRYENYIPKLPRKIALPQLRDVLFFILEGYAKKRANSTPNLPFKDCFFSMIEQTYLLPEIVCKVSFELLFAIQQYQEKHYDILEIVNIFQGKDIGCGRSMQIALSLIKQNWLLLTRDYNKPLHGDKIRLLIQLFYTNVPYKDVDETVKAVLTSDSVCLERDEYFITKLNKFFILGMRDLTEYWGNASELMIATVLHKDKITEEEFANAIPKCCSWIDSSKAQIRYKEALAAVKLSDPHASTIAARDLAYILQEYRWEYILQHYNELPPLVGEELET